MQKETSKTEGEFRIMTHKMKWYQNQIIKIMRLFNLNKLITDYVLRNGVMLADTGFRKNLGMTVRLPVIAGLYVNSGAQTAFGWLALGTSTTAPSAGQTTLVAELSTLGLSRQAATVSRVTTNSTNDTSQLSATWTASGSTTVEEVGYFNASSSGVMGGRALTTSMSVSNGVQITAVYKIIHT